MKILITDIEHNGEHYDEFEIDMPNVKSLEEIPEGRLEWYIKDCLEKLTK